MIDAGEVTAPDPGDLESQTREALLSNARAIGLVKTVRFFTLLLAGAALGGAFRFEAPTLVLAGTALCGLFLWAVGEVVSLNRDNLTLELLPAMVNSVAPEEAAEEILLRLRQVGSVGNRMRPVEYVLLDTLAAILRPALSPTQSVRPGEASPTLDFVFSTLPRDHVRYLFGYLGASGARTWLVIPTAPRRPKVSSAWLLPWWRELVWALSFFLIAMSVRSNVLMASVFLFAAPMPSFTLIVAKTRMKREIREACQRLLKA